MNVSIHAHCGTCKRMAHLFEFLCLTTQTTMQNMRAAVNTATVIATATPTIMPSSHCMWCREDCMYDELLIKATHTLDEILVCIAVHL